MENSGLQYKPPTTQFLDEAEVSRGRAGKLSILLVSDIHLAYDKIKLLLNWYQEVGQKKFDYVFASGDFGNIMHDTEGGVDPTEESKAEADIQAVLQQLENFMAPIYYIPGNHDPSTMFLDMDKRPNLTINSQNIHNSWVELRPNLGLAALGGSCASYMQKHGETKWESIYFAYPYADDDKFKRELDSLLAQVKTKQVIVMTHDGPQGSSTAQDKTERRDEGIIHFGSPALYKLLKENQQKIFCNIHGHCHEGSPLDKIQNLRIINPGSLSHGEFGELELIQDANGQWQVRQFNKHYL